MLSLQLKPGSKPYQVPLTGVACVFGIADDILVLGYEADSKDHEDTLQKVLKMYRKVNLILDKDRCHFRCTSVPF